MRAVKGNAMVIMENKDYEHRMENLLNDTSTYESMKYDPYTQAANEEQ